MEEFLKQLQGHAGAVEEIGNRIECGEHYMEEVRNYLPSLNQMVTEIFQMKQEPGVLPELNSEFVIQVLNDILYGMEHEDAVFLLDVLRYGLMEIYHYIETELQSEEA